MTDVGDGQWLDRQSRRLEGVVVDPMVRMVIQQVVNDSDQRCWHVVIGDGTVRLVSGEHAAPDITLTVDAGTARAIAGGRTSPQRVFLDGRLRIGGDITVLMEARETLARLL